MSKRIFAAAMLVVLASPFMALAAEVQGDTGSEQAGDWSWRVTPYVWLSGLNGKVGVFSGLPAADASATFGDIFDVTDYGFQVNTEKRFTEKLAFVGDFSYMKLSTDIDIPAEAGGGKIALESTTMIAQPMVAYRLVEGEDYMFDLLGGGRVWTLENEVKVKGGTHDGAKRDDKEQWLDPLLGFRVRKDLNEKWFLNFQGDLGGFDVGSQFTWMGQAGVGYHINDRVAALLMYRYLDVDYENDGMVWDVSMEGVLLGVSYLF